MPNKNVIEALMSATGCTLQPQKALAARTGSQAAGCKTASGLQSGSIHIRHTNIRSCAHTHMCTHAHTHACKHTHRHSALSSTPMITSSKQNVDSHMYRWGCLEGSCTCPRGLSTETHLLLRPQGTRQASLWPRVILRVKSSSTGATQTRDSTASLLWSTAQDNKQRGSHRGHGAQPWAITRGQRTRGRLCGCPRGSKHWGGHAPSILLYCAVA